MEIKQKFILLSCAGHVPRVAPCNTGDSPNFAPTKAFRPGTGKWFLRAPTREIASPSYYDWYCSPYSYHESRNHAGDPRNDCHALTWAWDAVCVAKSHPNDENRPHSSTFGARTANPTVEELIQILRSASWYVIQASTRPGFQRRIMNPSRVHLRERFCVQVFSSRRDHVCRKCDAQVSPETRTECNGRSRDTIQNYILIGLTISVNGNTNDSWWPK